MLHATVPRQLRVRSSIQLAGTRVPARAFLIVAGLIFAGGLMVVAGADIDITVQAVGVLIVTSLIAFELRIWGLSTWEVAGILWRHYRRPRQVRLEPITFLILVEDSVAAPSRRPRWQPQD